MSRAMHDRPGGPTPAIRPQGRPADDAGRMAAFLAPGLRATFDGCLTEALPADLAGPLADLLGRLDRPRGARRPGDRDAALRCPRTPDSFQRS